MGNSKGSKKNKMILTFQKINVTQAVLQENNMFQKSF